MKDGVVRGGRHHAPLSFAALILVLCAGLLSTTPVTATTSLLQNGDFTANTAGWNFLAGGINFFVYPGDSRPPAGHPYLESNVTVPGYSFYQDIALPLERGATYGGGLWVRSVSGRPLALTIALVEMGGPEPRVASRASFVVRGNGWRPVSVRHTIATAGRTALRLQIILNTTRDNYDFRDGAMAPCDGPIGLCSGPNALRNGDFAENTAFWVFPQATMNWFVYPGVAGPYSRPYLEMNTPVVGGTVFQDVPLVLPVQTRRGTPYLASVWARAHTDRPMTLTFALYASGGSKPASVVQQTYTLHGQRWQYLSVGRTLDARDRTTLRFQIILDTTRDNYDFSDARLAVQPMDSGSV